MFRVFQEERLITICMFAFLAGSILLRIFLGLLYRNMIKEADNMASTRNRLLKQCKTKFASCYQLGNGVANIPVFVDKFLNRMALGPLSFETIYHMSGQMMLLSVVFSGIGVCKSIIGGRTVGEVLPFYIVSFFGLYVYFSVSTVVNVRGKRRVLKINLVDYLENHLSPRIEVTRQDMEMLYGEAAYEEKRLPGGRGQGGRSSKGKGRRRGTRAVPEKRRTVELMPIESRMAAGGEFLQDEVMPGQDRQIGRMGQIAWEENGRQIRESAEAEMPSQRMRMGGEGIGRQTMGTSDTGRGYPERQDVGETAEWRTGQMPEAEEQQMTYVIGTASGLQADPGAETELESCMTQTSYEDAGGRTRQTRGVDRTVSRPDSKAAEQMTQMSNKNIGQMKREEQESGRPMLWAEQEQQFAQDFSSKQETPEDSAAVTEEELEALLKEFLTT